MGAPKGGIAFFDSGIGGLSVLAACRKQFPTEVFYYYGDNGRAPYGNLPPATIRRLVLRSFKKFRRLKVRAAVVACNTATAICVEELRARFPFPVVGTEPAVFPAAKAGGEIFILSTKATYESARFRELLSRAQNRYPDARLRAFACEGLAGEIERRLTTGADFTKFLPTGKPTAVVLGCTHYSFIREEIEDFYGCKSYDGGEGIARRLGALLKEKPLVDHLRPQKGKFPHEKDARKEESRVGSEGDERGQAARKQPTFPVGIYFLGGHKNQNKRIYEQMFGI